MLNHGCDCGVCFLPHLKLELSKKYVEDPKTYLQLRFGFLGGFVRIIENLAIVGWSIKTQLT